LETWTTSPLRKRLWLVARLRISACMGFSTPTWKMVIKAYATPEAVNKVLYICSPEYLSMHEALHIFSSIVHPGARQLFVPLWIADLIARLGRRRELQDALPFFRYCERVKIILSGSSEEANALLGAPTTTLEEWSWMQAAHA